MASRRLINLVLALCVTLGLALGPVVTPASAMAPAMAMGDMAAMAADMDMAEDMPCCPSEQHDKDCPGCPLLAICMQKPVQAGAALAPAMVVRHAVRTQHRYRDDALADGVDRPPPDHPPRA